MNSVGKSALSNQANSLSAGAKYAMKSNSGINWKDFNYPPCFRVIHYNRSELLDPHRGIATKLWACHIIIVVISILNIINNIVQVAQGSGGMRIGYSIVFSVLFNPLAGICFYTGLLAFLEDESKFLRYKILSTILGLAYIAFAIGNFGNFDGFVRIPQVSAFPIILCIIESILFLIAAAGHGFLVYKSVVWDEGTAKLAEAASLTNKERSPSTISQA